ncbi:MAG: hypothetical protein KAJ32_06190 [Gammaproteobacteria bacterium]|nr:hypothetical protein [Gammaproteobacteria bacterium]
MYVHNIIRKFSQLALLSVILGIAACSGDDLTGPPPADDTTTTGGGGTTGGTTSTVTIGTLTATPNTVSAGGTSIISVDLVDETGAVATVSTTIDFTSACVTNGMATFSTTSVTTTTGIATTTYTATGCVGSDLITATINGTTLAASANVIVASTLPASINFSTSSATLIALKGNGGSSGLPESAIITFEVLDNNGGPVVGENVDFTLSTTLGGISLSFPNATSDGNGQVQAILQSGNFSTSVRIIATVTSNPALTTPSTAIAIATGPPEQNGISLSASELNPRAWNNDGTQVTITARLTDKFQNNIADGTAILFTSELGGIEPSCTTVDGTCSVTWSSKDPRTNSLASPGLPGITTILARVVGEEHFNDSDGDGVFSDGDTFVDLPEAFRDDNGNGSHDAFEFFDDINNNNSYDTGSNKYNGIGCIHTTDCDTTSDTITVRDSIQLVMAEDNANIFLVQYNNSGTVPLGTTFDTTIDSSITFTIGGGTNGNVLPVGTTIKFTTTNGEIIGSPDSVVGNTVSTAKTYTVFLAADSTPSSDGFLTIEVDTGDGSGPQSFAPIPISDGTINNTRIGAFIATIFTEGVISLSSNSIAPSGTSNLTVDLVDLAGTPITTSASVSFTSPCIASGAATLNSGTVVTSTGQVIVTYTDVFCTGTDTITASLNGTTSTATGTITITATSPAPGSITQSGITSSTIALAGTGSSSGLPETTTLTFIIEDANGNTIQGEAVSFSLNSTVGGISLSSLAETSNVFGEVITTVQSGTVATSVRVTATVDSNTALTTASSAIAIATGPPDQNSMSISAETLNPRAWNIDSKEVTINALVADRYNNPITDGTAISFTTEFGAVTPSCITTSGRCSVTWRSQNPRANALGGTPGVTTIMATVEGEESFSDVDGDGVFSDGDSFTDLEEAFRDDNNNAIYDAGEFFVDFDGDFGHDGISTKYNGKGCIHSTLCDAADAVTVRDSIQLVLAEDVPTVSQVQFDSTPVAYPVGTPTFSTLTDSSVSFTIGGTTNGQILPIGSTINFGVTNGSIVSGGSHTVSNSNSGAGTYTVFITKDDTPSDDGFLTIDVNIGDGGNSYSFTPIAINDVGQTYSIGGTVTGLPVSESVTLQNNAGDNLPVNADGTFTFATPLSDGESYEVTIGLQPVSATCTVALETGTVAGSNVTDVVVTCM